MSNDQLQNHSFQETLDLFRRGPDILEAVLKDVSVDESQYVAMPGKWTIREITRHLTDTEIVVGMRLRQMITEPRPLMATFDQDLWADYLHYNQCDAHDSAAKFRVLRSDMSAILDRLEPEEFERIGLHAERGAETLGQWVTRFAVHVQKHAGQIQRIREQWSAR